MEMYLFSIWMRTGKNIKETLMQIYWNLSLDIQFIYFWNIPFCHYWWINLFIYAWWGLADVVLLPKNDNGLTGDDEKYTTNDIISEFWIVLYLFKRSNSR